MASDSQKAGLGARQLTFLYVAALSTVALLSIAGQVVVQHAIASQSSDARIINVAGRQRMLSQRLSKAVLELERTADAARAAALRTEIDTTLDGWTRAHSGLMVGAEELGLSGTRSERARAELDAITSVHQRMRESARAILEAGQPRLRDDAVVRLLDDEDSYLEAMDDIVYLLEREASARVQALRRIEITLLMLTLLVLAVEGTFVFRPAVRALRRSMERMRDATAREANTALELTTILDNVPALIWYQDEHGRIVRANRRAQRVVGEKWALDEVSRQLDATVEQGQSRLSLPDPGGNPVHLDIKCEPYPNAAGKTHGYVILAEDVTERENLEKQLLQIKVDEQRRIGHDLHDGVGQILTGVLYLSRRLHTRLLRRDDPSADSASEIVDHIRDSIAQVRTLTRGLCPLDEKEGGLICALRELTDQTARLSGIRCMFEFDQSIASVDPSVDEQLYRIAQEAVSNVVRHADASAIQIDLRRDEKRVRLVINDNGSGIRKSRSNGHRSGMGIRIMRRRAELCGATLHIDAHNGTRVACEVPLDPEKESHGQEAKECPVHG